VAEVLALVDYGAGNLHSVANALKAAGAHSVTVTADPDVVRAADRIVLPGVGSFKACAEGLRAIPHLEENIARWDWDMSPALAAELDALINRQTVAGPRYGPAMQASIDTEDFD